MSDISGSAWNQIDLSALLHYSKLSALRPGISDTRFSLKTLGIIAPFYLQSCVLGRELAQQLLSDNLESKLWDLHVKARHLRLFDGERASTLGATEPCWA